jgi:hypothetical protein
MLPITHREPERGFQEAMREFLIGYFDGQIHALNGESVEFPSVPVLFGPEALPKTGASIHCAFVDCKTHETHSRGSNIPDIRAFLYSPIVGVDYLFTADGVAECVHGRSVRILTGTDIRWQTSGDDLLEQTLVGSTWTTQRTITGTATLTWQRGTTEYLEKSTSGATVRTIPISETLWDGALIRVCREVVCTWFIRHARSGQGTHEHLVRRIAALLENLLSDKRAAIPLTELGIRSRQFVSKPYAVNDDVFFNRAFATRESFEYHRPHALF